MAHGLAASKEVDAIQAQSGHVLVISALTEAGLKHCRTTSTHSIHMTPFVDSNNQQVDPPALILG
jgi:hypothetical protein